MPGLCSCPVPLTSACSQIVKTLTAAPRSIHLAGSGRLQAYGVHVPTDPTPFLSTIVTTSAALVAIIGGLLVAKFVGLDSEERSSRKVVADAAERLEVARTREQVAWREVHRWGAASSSGPAQS